MSARKESDKEQDMISEILENFDFEKVRQTMEFLDWRWGLDSRVVSVDMLRRAAIVRMEDAMQMAKKGLRINMTYFSSSGGLKACAWRNRFGHIEAISLEFILSDWHSEGD